MTGAGLVGCADRMCDFTAAMFAQTLEQVGQMRACGAELSLKPESVTCTVVSVFLRGTRSETPTPKSDRCFGFAFVFPGAAEDDDLVDFALRSLVDADLPDDSNFRFSPCFSDTDRFESALDPLDTGSDFARFAAGCEEESRALELDDEEEEDDE